MAITFYLRHTYICIIRSFLLYGPAPAPFGPRKRESSADVKTLMSGDFECDLLVQITLLKSSFYFLQNLH